jgi:hypothetical protein
MRWILLAFSSGTDSDDFYCWRSYDSVLTWDNAIDVANASGWTRRQEKCRQRTNFVAGSATSVVRLSQEHILYAICSKSGLWRLETLTIVVLLDHELFSIVNMKNQIGPSTRETVVSERLWVVQMTLTCVNSLALSNAVKPDIAVRRTLSLNVRSFKTLRSANLADWMRRSQLPQKCGEARRA